MEMLSSCCDWYERDTWKVTLRSNFLRIFSSDYGITWISNEKYLFILQDRCISGFLSSGKKPEKRDKGSTAEIKDSRARAPGHQLGCKTDIFRYLLNLQDTVLIYFKHYMLMQSRYLSYICLSFRCTNRCVSFLWEFCELLTGSIYCQSDTVIISGNRTNNMFFPDIPDISDISDFPDISGIFDILILLIFLFTCLSSCLEGKSLMRCTYHCIWPNMSYSKKRI